MQRFSETNPKLGITMLATCNTLSPSQLAVEVESRGFDSLWLPEHSHIPTSRATPFPGAAPAREELPDVYWHLNDQLVALSMAAAVTENLILGTAVTLVAQHDPIWLAKQLATLDFHSQGRLEVGVGFGWNREEYGYPRINDGLMIFWKNLYNFQMQLMMIR